MGMLMRSGYCIYRQNKLEEALESLNGQEGSTESMLLESQILSSEVQGTLDLRRVKETSSFELAYNTACSLIEREKYKDPEQLLLSTRRQNWSGNTNGREFS
ncbi:hypothetical protein H5410_002457 [Solanum commersonii]|uniref:Uncharacterized protein n=1 Tax=Solanum commersonii TaxID=4109 RepID=A0A9J6B268_SOLCO|nr:hypothetical protein H5410_002457 [Solanum commersonii]